MQISQGSRNFMKNRLKFIAYTWGLLPDWQFQYTPHPMYDSEMRVIATDSFHAYYTKDVCFTEFSVCE